MITNDITQMEVTYDKVTMSEEKEELKEDENEKIKNRINDAFEFQ